MLHAIIHGAKVAGLILLLVMVIREMVRDLKRLWIAYRALRRTGTS